MKVSEKVCRPTQRTEITSNLTDTIVSIEGADESSLAWVDIEDILSEEWEIGGLAMTTDAIRALVAGE